MIPVEKRSALRFSAVFALAALLVVGAVAGFNAAVDPFGMYRTLELDGFNVRKPGIYKRVRLMKAYELRRVKPTALVVGTSRSHLALRPSHEGWDGAQTRRYNLAFDGATTKEMYHYLLHAHAVQPLRQVVLGLDSYHPQFSPARTRPDFDAQILETPGSWLNAPRRLLADLKILVSVDTLKASLETIRAQGDTSPEWFAADGQRLGEVFFRTVGGTFLSAGPRAYFDEIDRLEVGFQSEGRAPAKAKQVAPAPPVPPEETAFGYVRRIVEFCRQEDIDLRVFITPSHVHQLEISAATSGWEGVERGKRELVRLLAEDVERHPGAKPFPLHDFSGYSSVTTEPLPAVGSRDEMAYYWDSSHFKENVGDMVLDRIFAVERPDRPVPADFGVVLTARNIDAVLAATRAAQADYRATHVAEIESIRAMAAAAAAPAAQPLRSAGPAEPGQPPGRSNAGGVQG